MHFEVGGDCFLWRIANYAERWCIFAIIRVSYFVNIYFQLKELTFPSLCYEYTLRCHRTANSIVIMVLDTRNSC